MKITRFISAIDNPLRIGDLIGVMNFNAFMMNAAFPSGRPAVAVGVRFVF